MLHRHTLHIGSALLFVAAACGDPDPDPPTTCELPTGAGTDHGSAPTADETWTAAASPHTVTANITLPAGRTVTIEPCAIVRMRGAVGLLVEGKLLAEGTTDRPIRIEGTDAATPWTTIEARRGAELRFAHVTVDGGGNANGGRIAEYGMLDIRGDQDAPTQPILFADHLTLSGSRSLGILVREGGGFASGSTDLTITGGATYPISIWGRAAGTLPTGTYTGNAIDEILLPALGGRDDIKEDTTLKALGAPYRVGGPLLRVLGSPAPVLTIQAGTTLRFADNARLHIETGPAGPGGALIAAGTAAAPITFTSAATAPVAGSWVGLVFSGMLDPRNQIANARISFAGGPSQISSFDCQSPLNTGFSNEGGIVIAGTQPPSGFVTNTTIATSAGDGVVRGWTGSPVDFLATNTFTAITRCNETFPKPTGGACPVPAPCPR